MPNEHNRTSDYECIHCGEIDKTLDHWERCEDHPAQKVVALLRVAVEALEVYYRRESYLHDDGVCSPICTDEGTTARTALTTILTARPELGKEK